MKLKMFTLSLMVLLQSVASAEGPQGFHGMLVFGLEKAYISHLPMFHPLHKYQGIWEVHFETPEGKPASNYTKDKMKNPDSYYTLAPTELFFLPDLAQLKHSFKASLFRGHFERPGKKLVEKEVVVVLDKLVHFHEFKTNQIPASQLEYILVGSGTEWFAVHLITTSPNFDQVVPVAAQAEYVSGAILSLDQKDEPFTLKETTDALIEVAGVKEPTQMQALDVLYTEVDELSDSLEPIHHGH